ncbi:MAG: class I SAM-dependent methyltransferase [Halodesulfurarchaeum sp.]
MRRFSPEYLEDTRRGMWEDRSALESLRLPDRDRILDVGAGSGALTRVLREESDAMVVSLDADIGLLTRIEGGYTVAGDALTLPFPAGTFDLVVCQALLINLPDPQGAIEQFRRVSSDLVAAIEPDNRAVEIDSTVPAESRLSDRARTYYMRGLDTDVGLGPDVGGRFRDAGLERVSVQRYDHERAVSPPYAESALESAKRKVTASRLQEQRPTLLQGGLSEAEFESLVDDWQAMGRAIVTQIGDETYRRRAVVPFYVTVGRVPQEEPST